MARITVAQLEEKIAAYQDVVRELENEVARLEAVVHNIENTVSKLKKADEARSRSWIYRLINRLGGIK